MIKNLVAAKSLTVVIGACMLSLQPSAAELDYPSRPVRIVVPYPAGGPLDAFTRQLAARLGTQTGGSFFVDNRGGGLGVIGLQAVASASGDGYTLLSTSIETHVNNIGIFNKMPFDINTDFVPVTQTLSLPVVLACNAKNVPVKTFAEFLALAEQRKGKMTYGTWGVGSVSHVLSEALSKRYGLAMTHVPYKGGGPLVQDLLGGQVDCAFQGVTVTTPYVEKGQLVALGISGSTAVRSLPSVPTLKQLGLTEDVFGTRMWFGLFAPKGTPNDVVAKLTKSVQEVLAAPEFVKILADQAYDVEATDPKEFAARIARDQKVTLRLMADMGIEKQ